MDYSTSPPRGRYGVPKPEDGLAEWTSKIRAMQQQVDADEEAEQKKLEAEITASRLARQRRSSRMGSKSRTNSVDLANLRDILPPSRAGDDATASEDVKSDAERQRSQVDALQRLTGSQSEPPSRQTTSAAPTSHPPLATKRADPISLAAFMGGRATGPILNKHAPQQDAHDPTQFDQRTRTTAPHPVFGRGGIAMPGMTSKLRQDEFSTGSSRSLGTNDQTDRRLSSPSANGPYPEAVRERSISPQKTGGRDRTLSTPASSSRNFATAPDVRVTATNTPPKVSGPYTNGGSSGSLSTSESRDRRLSSPSVASHYMENVRERSLSPQKTGSRDRTLSTPAGPSRSPIPDTRASPFITSTGSTPVSNNTRPKTPTREAYTSLGRTSTSASPLPPSSRPYTPSRMTHSTSVSPPQKSPVVTPSLARPIQPDRRPVTQSPQIPPSSTPSAAFLKPPAQKDPTPSISRLQGRGFVQNMVQVSKQLESPNSAPITPERTGGRKSSVLDRWPGATRSPPNPSPQASTKPSPPVRKSVTIDSSFTASEDQKSLKSRTSLPSMVHADKFSPVKRPLTPQTSNHALRSQDAPKLGSATTMMVFQPSSAETEISQYAEVDELGVQRDIASNRANVAFKPSSRSELPASPGKPLIHPTKERARKPKKTRNEAKVGEPSVVGNPPGHQTPSVSSSAPHTSLSLVDRPRPSDHRAQDSPPSFTASPSPVADQGSQSVNLLAHKWSNQSLIGSKSTSSVEDRPSAPKTSGMVGRRALPGMVPVVSSAISQYGPKSPSTEEERPSAPKASGMVGRRALPGMVPATPSTDSQHVAKPLSNANLVNREEAIPIQEHDFPISTRTTDIAASGKQEENRPTPHTRPARIPITGKRATVMDVAQNLSNQGITSEPESLPSFEENSLPLVPAKPTISPKPTHLTPRTLSNPEKRKSSFEKYSSIILPPLKEEATPTPTPAGTLSREAAGTVASALKSSIELEIGTKLEEALVNVKPAQEIPALEDVHLTHVDGPLPVVDVKSLLMAPSSPVTLNSSLQTISVDVMAITGNSATSFTDKLNIFHDTEILAIIHRTKSKSTGLASTTVWGWQGRQRQLDTREEQKLQDLAKRYGASVIHVRQYAEPKELVVVLGGRLIVRQGPRAHWSAENTAMHLVRLQHGVVFIDEHDLTIRNLCSGFSYCVSVLGNIYVWFGVGSVPTEREAAREYAQTLGTNIVELTQGEDDDDEMFWMVLGDEEFAKADYWRWRSAASAVDPLIWEVNASRDKDAVTPSTSFATESSARTSTYVVDCIWELFVVVGREARGHRDDIRLAVSVAKDLAAHYAPDRPYFPTVHVLVLPSQLPIDLRLHFRDVDEASLNDGDVPDHMNLISAEDALDHLQRRVWEKDALKDETMLPLGIDVSQIS